MKKGFTLIELLLVVAIISLLSSVVFAGLKEARNKAVRSAFVSEVRSLYQEAEIFFVSANRYAPSNIGTDGNILCPTSVDSGWGFFGTSKGIELINSIQKRTGSQSVYCAVTPNSWAFFSPVYVSLFSLEKNNVAYAQNLLGYICFDSSSKTIRSDIDVLEGSDGIERQAAYTIKFNSNTNTVVCSP